MDGVKAEPVFYLITREDLNRLVEAAIATANPPTHLSCDWLGGISKEKLWRRLR